MERFETSTQSHLSGKSDNWFQSEPGESLLEAEKLRLSRILPDLFGYHILQLSTNTPDNLIVSSRIRHKILAGIPSVSGMGKMPDFICHNSALPVATDSLDVVLLHHVLEFEPSPHQVLREIERILIGEGHIVIVGFSPWSLWGIWRLIYAWAERFPWKGHYLSLSRLKDWLTLLDFEIISTEKFYFRPPFKNSKLISRLNFIEHIGKYC